MNIKNYDLVIFDCDGTLVDSEYLNNKASIELLAKYDYAHYTTEEFLNEFAGKSWDKIKTILDERHAINISQSMVEDYVVYVQERLRIEDLSIHGAKEFVAYCSNHIKVCVGSNGERANVITAIDAQGYKSFFEKDTIFTKSQVKNPKPAPDLFLYAAKQMGDIAPSRCLVIEDSEAGAAAGVAAGMDVFGFTGVSHDKKRAESLLKDVGVTAIFDNFIHMQDALEG